MSQDCCSICLEPLMPKTERSRPIGAASCGHCLHCECYFRWKDSKTNPYYEDESDDEEICPCPVCNQPIYEFVRLYISGGGDQGENERLRKELKSMKRKLVQEKYLLQQANHQLLYSAPATAPAGISASTRASSSRQQSSHRLDNNANADGDRVISLSRSQSNTDSRKQQQQQQQQQGGRQRSSRYRRHESCPLYFDSGSDSERGNRAVNSTAAEVRPDPPSPWSLRDGDGGGDDGDVNGDKLERWVHRMAIAVSPSSAVVSDSSSSSLPEDPPTDDQ